MAKADKLLREHLSERFVVTLDDETTFVGLLRDVDDRVLSLVDVVQLAPNGDQVRVDGQLYVERFRIAYMQRP